MSNPRRINQPELKTLISKHKALVAGVEENSRTLEALLDLQDERAEYEALKRELTITMDHLRNILARLKGEPLLQ